MGKSRRFASLFKKLLPSYFGIKRQNFPDNPRNYARCYPPFAPHPQAKDVHSLAKKFDVFPPSETSSAQASRVPSAKGAVAAEANQQQHRQQHQQQQQQHQQLRSSQKNPAVDTQGKAYQAPVFHDDHRFHEAPYYSQKLPAHLLTEDEKQLGGSGARIPAYLTSGRPGAKPNSRQARVEDPVRRKIFSTSVVGSSLIGQLGLRRMRGLNALPVRLDFGLVREGCTYQMTLHLVNTGVESCRWRVTAPPPATGVRLLFESGAIAAGMRREVNIEIYAIAAGVEGSSGIGLLNHQLQVITETDVLNVPINARVMTAHEYDKLATADQRLSRGVRMTSNKPPDRDGIIRPRRADTNLSKPTA